jgi:hypothetical protein
MNIASPKELAVILKSSFFYFNDFEYAVANVRQIQRLITPFFMLRNFTGKVDKTVFVWTAPRYVVCFAKTDR